MKSKNYKCTKIVLLLVFTLTSFSLSAQVAIGANEAPKDFSLLELNTTLAKLGLRLPQLTTEERDALTKTTHAQASPALVKGLAIYNLDTDCVDYWNGSKWINLCSGHTTFEGGGCAENPIASTGGSVSCAITDPECATDGEYSFAFVSGGDFANIEVTDAGAGQFILTFDPNDRATDRQSIVMVSSSCGASTLLVFTQEGDTEGCGTTTVPVIKSVGDASTLCAGGAAYLYLDTYPTSGTYIWTLNGQQVGTGYSYAATVPGKYIVYGDKIGCVNKKEFQLTLDGMGAPLPVQLIVIGNNGQACGIGGTVPLITSAPVSGTIIWFKDGILQTDKVGTEIEAGKGYWEAVVKDGNCYSAPSAGITVTENTSGGSIPQPVMKINGLTSGWKLCRGGSLFLEVENIEANITYTWYADNTQIGTGSGIYYPVPSSDQVVIRLRASGAGCAQEAYSIEAIGIDQAPDAPYISCNTPGNSLCGGQATLSASGGTSYRWFEDGVEIAGEIGSSIVVTRTGSYTAVAISSGGCQSVQSGAKVIAVSDFATLTWVNHPATALHGDTKTYSVNLDFPQGASYTWSVDNGAKITNGQGTASVTVRFPAADVICTVTCEADNACGDAVGSPLSQAVLVEAGCNDAVITSHSALNPSVTVGETAAMSITATGTELRYQWYGGIVGSGYAVPGATSAGYEYETIEDGFFNFYCVVTPTGGCLPASSKQFSLEVKIDPSTFPVGTAAFTGKTCFDIAYSNDNTNACAPLSSRIGQKTTFANRNAQDPINGVSTQYSGVQIYTFTPSGTVSNLRFDFKDPSGKVIEKYEVNGVENGSYPGNISSGTACKVTVYYKPSLETDLRGLTRANALKAELYAIYTNVAGIDMAVKLNATLSDCACCGAKTVNGAWLTFMCHNLGANESIDPFTPNTALHGDLYQWGRPKDGHEKRTSKYIPTLSSSNIPGHPNFIRTPNQPYDWRSGGGENARWGDGTSGANPKKADNDPCPAGWKVPSQAQWGSIFRGGEIFAEPSSATANTWTSKGAWGTTVATGGYMVGDALFLPAAGYRNYSATTALQLVGTSGYYWSSTADKNYSLALRFNTTVVTPGYIANRANGYSVRCVAE